MGMTRFGVQLGMQGTAQNTSVAIALALAMAILCDQQASQTG